jgi:fatty-acid peroxygenase
VQEVRRFYPFFPSVAARVRRTFTWRGYRFPKGTRVLLDLYGTNHDGRVWGQPDAFIPKQFYGWDGSAYNFISQGGGDHLLGHRCAGEWITISLMKVAMDFLTRSISYTVPPQNVRINLSRMSSIPGSQFVIRKVRLVE